MSVSLRLEGDVPSKKNARKVRYGQAKAYLPGPVQAEIDALLLLAKSQRHKLDLASIAGSKLHVTAHFIGPKEHRDLDNVFTTLLDILQTAGIIENDKLVRSFSVSETVALEKPSVTVTIDRLSTPRE